MASAVSYASMHLAPDRQPCQHPTTQLFYRLDALPATQPTASKNRKLYLANKMHVATLADDTPAHQTLRHQIDISLGQVPGSSLETSSRSPKKQVAGSVSLLTTVSLHQLICGDVLFVRVSPGWCDVITRVMTNQMQQLSCCSGDWKCLKSALSIC